MMKKKNKKLTIKQYLLLLLLSFGLVLGGVVIGFQVGRGHGMVKICEDLGGHMKIFRSNNSIQCMGEINLDYYTNHDGIIQTIGPYYNFNYTGDLQNVDNESNISKKRD